MTSSDRMEQAFTQWWAGSGVTAVLQFKTEPDEHPELWGRGAATEAAAGAAAAAAAAEVE